MMTARQTPGKLVLFSATIGAAALLAGGCSSSSTPISARPARAKATFLPSAAPGVGPGEAAANSPAFVDTVDRIPSPEPIKVPVINMFGELDGQISQSQPQSADFGFQQHTFSDEGYDADVNIDPSGKWIAFSSTRHTERSEIYLQRVDGTSVTQLTSDISDNAQPCFSPDGKSIAFCSTRAGSWDIYTMDLDGRNVVQVTNGPSQDMHPSFSPDGTRLVYSSMGGRSGQWELWTVSLATREHKMIGYGLFPTWSPDKNADKIAFQRARQRGSRWFSLWTLDLVDGEARKVTEVAVSSNAAIISPCWNPEGKRLAFATVVDPAQTNKGKPRGQQDIWVIDAEGGNRHRLTDGTATCLTPFWAMDNRVYFVSDRGGHENVWSVRTERPREWPLVGKPAKEGPGGKTAVGSTGGELEK